MVSHWDLRFYQGLSLGPGVYQGLSLVPGVYQGILIDLGFRMAGKKVPGLPVSRFLSAGITSVWHQAGIVGSGFLTWLPNLHDKPTTNCFVMSPKHVLSFLI